MTLSFSLAIMERGVTFPTHIVVFSQSQCSGSVSQSEQTALVGRRDFVENVSQAFRERRGIEDKYLKKLCIFGTLKHVNKFCYTK